MIDYQASARPRPSSSTWARGRATCRWRCDHPACLGCRVQPTVLQTVHAGPLFVSMAVLDCYVNFTVPSRLSLSLSLSRARARALSILVRTRALFLSFLISPSVSLSLPYALSLSLSLSLFFFSLFLSLSLARALFCCLCGRVCLACGVRCGGTKVALLSGVHVVGIESEEHNNVAALERWGRIRASQSHIIIINQNDSQATSGFEMCFCYPYVQDKCPIMHQRPLFHT